jgi:uncharacterized protein (TIGR03663 family)
MNRWLTLALVIWAGAALALRWPHLAERPMHNDEAVNAVKAGALWDAGQYQYDPNEYHGPSLHYSSVWWQKLTHRGDSTTISASQWRFAVLLFGLALVLLTALLRDGLGQAGTFWAGLFLAVSPAFVFYSQYYIHEMLLVFGAGLSLGAGWRYWRTRRWWWALWAGMGLGLTHATKETFVIQVAAAVVALVANQVWSRYFDASEHPEQARKFWWPHLFLGCAAWLLVAGLFFTSFGSNPRGLVDSVLTYQPWLGRAGGDSPHIHPWSFYLERLLWFHAGKGPVWTELSILVLALVGVWSGFARQTPTGASAGFLRFLTIYSFLTLAVYSGISYKTPWCLLGFWHGFALLAGAGAALLVERGFLFFRVRALLPGGGSMAMRIVLVSVVAHLAWQGWMLSSVYAADRRNPHVYAQTSRDLTRLVDLITKLAQCHPEGRGMLVKVVSPEGDYWPLPWELRGLKRVGWYDALPGDPYAPVMVVHGKLHARLDERKTHLMTGYFELRPGVLLETYVELGLWKSFLERFPPRSDPE